MRSNRRSSATCARKRRMPSRSERRRAELIQRFFGKLFAEGQRTGMVRRDLPAKLMIEILLAAVQAIVNPAKVEELGLTPKTGFASVVKVVLEGVITPKGRKT